MTRHRAENRRWVCCRRLVLAVSALLVASCTPSTEPSSPRVLLVGMDGATLRMVAPLIEEGRLPNLAKLRAEGVSGSLQSFVPLLSPRVWTTVATGKTPPHHGIGNWVKAPGPDGTSELFYSYDRKTKALWNIVSDAGMKVSVVNWLVTYPPEIIDGVMVSDHTFAADVEGQAYVGQVFAEAAGWKFDPAAVSKQDTSPVFPPERLERVRSVSDQATKLTPFSDPFVTAELPKTAPRSALSGFYARDQGLTAIALDIDDELRPQVMMVLLQGVDRVSHYLFGCQDDPKSYPPSFQPTAEELAGCRRVLTDYYEYTDALIGRLVERFDGENDLVVVASDHGFEAGFIGFNLTGDHTNESASKGILFARGRGLPAGAPAGDVTVNDITPTILAWLGLPVGKDMDGKPLVQPAGKAVAAVDTHDTTPVRRLEGTKSGEEGHVLQQLKQLGYVD